MIKRFSLLSLILATAISLTACMSQNLGEPLTRNFETTEGELRSLGTIKVNELVTHLFETEKGEILYAYSARYDLDAYGDQTLEAYGVLTTYEDLDKALFEIKRLTVLEGSTDLEEAAVQEIYSSTALGVKFPVLSSWKLTASGDLVSFELPMPVQMEGDETVSSEETAADVIEIRKLLGEFGLSAEASQEEKVLAIQTYVEENDMVLAGLSGEIIQVGSDQLLGLKYKLDAGDVYVFIPRGEDLFELSYHFLSGDDSSRVDHSNRFASLLGGFRFISSDEVLEEPSQPSESTDLEDLNSPHETLPSQVMIDKYASFSSNGYNFSMDYPAAWYYVGGTTGYLFDPQEFEETTQDALLKLTMNTVSSPGVTRELGRSRITVNVASRTYTLEGPSEYETVMQTMLSSIETTKIE